MKKIFKFTTTFIMGLLFSSIALVSLGFVFTSSYPALCVASFLISSLMLINAIDDLVKIMMGDLDNGPA